MSLAEWRRDRLEQAAREVEIVKLTGPRSITTPFQPNRVGMNVDEDAAAARLAAALERFDDDIAAAILPGAISYRPAEATQEQRDVARRAKAAGA
ncbi:hypothetical protein AB6V29_01530 [Microbacterium sp. 20-116]|uniref:hypothetical protein n=1 Tax=Microbacterium sp. 20-116 TaxID=3239883 RepID=UPI0034E27ED0